MNMNEKKQPECFGDYGNPEDGLDCENCPFADDCASSAEEYEEGEDNMGYEDYDDIDEDDIDEYNNLLIDDCINKVLEGYDPEDIINDILEIDGRSKEGRARMAALRKQAEKGKKISAALKAKKSPTDDLRASLIKDKKAKKGIFSKKAGFKGTKAKNKMSSGERTGLKGIKNKKYFSKFLSKSQHKDKDKKTATKTGAVFRTSPSGRKIPFDM